MEPLMEFPRVLRGREAMVEVARPILGEDIARELANNIATVLGDGTDHAPATVAEIAIRHRIRLGWLVLDDAHAAVLAAELGAAWTHATVGP
jgi:hypothetical protein